MAHVIGKDILRFHAIYWPAMLLSAGVEVPDKVYVHGFLTKDRLKMGKSLGNTMNPFELVDQFSQDAVRYYFLRAIEFGQDGDYSEERFISVVNADLANNLGNLLNRSLNLLRKNCDSTPELDSSSIHHPLRAYTEEKIPNVMKKMQAMEFSDACAILMEILHEANLYIATEEPWVIFKRWVKFKRREKEEAVNCLCTCLECAWITAVALKPITPALSDRIYNALGFPSEERTGLTWKDAEWGALKSGQTFPKPVPVSPRLQTKEPVVVST